MEKLEGLGFDNSTEVRSFDKGHVDIVTLDGHPVMRAVLEPGWRWSDCVKPLVHTESCEVAHLGYMVSGRMSVHMNNGEEKTFGPGEIASIPPGHDAWTVGDEPAVFIDFQGAPSYAHE